MIDLRSEAFEEGAPIPTRHTCDGADLSPPLSWAGVPEGTRRLALICDDPDAPVGTWVHWVIYDLPPTAVELPAGVPTDPELEHGARQGVNDFGRYGYGGPCPPPGPAHRYFFRIYALDTELGLEAGAGKAELLEAMEGNVLDEGVLVGTYQR